MKSSSLEGIEVWKVGGVGVGLYNGNPLRLVWMWNVELLFGGDSSVDGGGGWGRFL
jgi:hypothetical protein